MNLIEQIQSQFLSTLHTQYGIDKLDQSCSLLLNTDPKKQQFGDLTSSAALSIGRKLNLNPRNVAQEITTSFSHPAIDHIEVAGPGFINLFLTNTAFVNLAKELFDTQETFFTLGPNDQKYSYNDEFISANPTGPLHFGHGRGGIIGDVLGNVLRFLGHTVTKEFYSNDVGNQIQKLGTSFKIRCQQELGKEISFPEDGYHGEYLYELAKDCVAQYGEQLYAKPHSFFASYAKDHLLNMIKQTVTDFGITFDVWFSEKSLHDSDSIKKAIMLLQHKGYTFEKDGALWFKSTVFGDDKDRVIKKTTGEWTYAAADIAYLIDKIQRGFNRLIMVLGHDHHSYAIRLHNICKALEFPNVSLTTILYQLVHIKKGTQLVQMSKRAGSMVTLEDVINAVGKDVARFFFLQRKADAPLEFDLQLALKKTDENPVYYIQYAYVRINSIFEKSSLEEVFTSISAKDVSSLSEAECKIVKKVISLKDLLRSIEQGFHTHLLTYYIIELADIFHKYYSTHRVLNMDNIAESRSRLVIMHIIKNSLHLTLELLGISRPEKM
jgi:arginyl-tRNA synthetase